MGTIKIHHAVRAFCAITFSKTINLPNVFRDLEEIFSPIALCSAQFNFDRFTDYYQPEMGVGLFKLITGFQNLIAPEELPDLKTKTNRLEEKYLSKDRRTLNLDPGYLTPAKVVLATTKDYSHRLYLGKGIFGDLHLQYHNKSYQPASWTYPDYKQEAIIEFFNRFRGLA
jgi:hypothetical protein